MLGKCSNVLREIVSEEQDEYRNSVHFLLSCSTILCSTSLTQLATRNPALVTCAICQRLIEKANNDFLYGLCCDLEDL